MFRSLTESAVVHLLLADDNAGWTYNGARALVAWLFELEDETGVPLELDVVGLRCEFVEYGSIVEAVGDHPDAGDIKRRRGGGRDLWDAHALEWFRDNGTVIEVEGGGLIVNV